MPKSKTKKSSKGVILLEVLIAIAILASACILISRSIIASFRAIHESQQYFEAQLIAESLLWNVRHGLSVDSAGVANMDRFPKLVVSRKSVMAWQGKLTQDQVILSWDGHDDKKTMGFFNYSLGTP
jgi:type II secretory pathway component PulJ